MTWASSWSEGAGGAVEPTYLPVSIEPSPEGADDTARLLAIATFNGLCRVIIAAARQGLLAREELVVLHDAMTAPLDDLEMRDDEVIACCRSTLEEVLSNAEWLRRNQHNS